MKSYVVIGMGLFGTRVATSLYKYGEDVLAIDQNEENVQDVADRVSRAVTADARDIEVLKRLGVSGCDCAVVAIGADLASSVLITMNLKNLGIPKIICKALNDSHREILEKLGADQIIIPENVVADRTARALASPNIMEFIELSEDYGIVECKVPQDWVGKSLKELNIRAKYGVNIIAIREKESVKVSPSADFRINPEAVLVLLGEYTALNKFKALK